MRLAVIADIHGNAYALDVALADITAQGVDQIVCLGDAIQGGQQPAETAQRLRALGCPIVMGNADAWLLDMENDTVEPTSPQQREVRAWTLAKLSAADVAFIRSFQPRIDIVLGEGQQRLLCFHGSPTAYTDVLLPDTPKAEWQRLLGPYAPAIMTGGHTHTQQVRRIGRHGFFFNPGSIGVAYSHDQPEAHFRLDPWAEYAILTATGPALSLEFRRVPFALAPLIDLVRQSGRPHLEQVITEYEE
jgi:predicted phosphodiesterase